MAAVLFGLASAVAALGSLLIFTSSKSAIHEILAVALGLVSAIFGVGSVVVYSLDRLPDRIAQAMTAERARLAPPVELDIPDARRRQEAGSLGRAILLVCVLVVAACALWVWYNQVR
jgi:hypothetical protein